MARSPCFVLPVRAKLQLRQDVSAGRFSVSALTCADQASFANPQIVSIAYQALLVGSMGPKFIYQFITNNFCHFHLFCHFFRYFINH